MQPKVKSQASIVQGLPSSQLAISGVPWQAPLAHVSVTVHP